MVNEAIIGAVGTVLGVVLSKAIDFFTAKRTANRDDKKAETSQALDIYKSLVTGLQKDVQDMLAHLQKLEDERLECREENARLKLQVENLTARVHELEGKLKAA